MISIYGPSLNKRLRSETFSKKPPILGGGPAARLDPGETKNPGSDRSTWTWEEVQGTKL